MLNPGNNPPMPEEKIARFVDIHACKSIFSENSTFVLRSPEHYIRLCETSEAETDKGDRDEGCAHTSNGGTHEFKGFVASCWTILDNDQPTAREWSIFPDTVLAIVSTPGTVCNFLNAALEIDSHPAKQKLPFLSVEHKKVTYEPAHVNAKNFTYVVPFTKHKQFQDQKEYRFVLPYTHSPYTIDSFIFCAGIDYMEKRYANPNMSSAHKNSLLHILVQARSAYGDFADKTIPQIIANPDILFPDNRS